MSVQIKLDESDNSNPKFKKVVLPKREAKGVIKDFKIVKVTRKKLNKETNVTALVEENRIVMDVEIPEGTISAWYPIKINKNGGQYKPTYLYKLLDTAKLIEKLVPIKEQIAASEENVLKFLKQYLIGKKVIFIPDTYKTSSGEEYSSISEVLEVSE